jgi:hypothetical protein
LVQEADILGEEAEHDAVEEVGDVGGVEARCMMVSGHVGELPGASWVWRRGLAGAVLFGVVKRRHGGFRGCGFPRRSRGYCG